MEINLKELLQPLQYQWKVQSVPKGWKAGQDLDKKASCVAYIDSRDVQNRLDEVVWAENWSSEFYEAKGKLFCKIGIRVNWEWVYKSDSGALEGSDFVEAETTSKWESSDAFKRAGVMFGIGRFLYDMEIQWIDNATYQKYKYKLTEYINNLNGKPPIQWNNAPIRDDVPQIPKYTPKGKQLAEYISEIKSEHDTNVIKTLQDEAKQGRLSEKQIWWLDKEVEARLTVLRNSPF